MFKVDLLGWIATAAMLSSFFFKDRHLKYIQLFGCGMWAAYGLEIDSKPVIAANFLMVLSIAFSLIIIKSKTPKP